MGRHAPAPIHGHPAGQGLAALSAKKSLTRPAQAGPGGQARAGREANTARKGRLLGKAQRGVDWVKTLGAKGGNALQPDHLRYRRPPVGSSSLHCVLIDMSASMLKGQKLALAKGCLLALTEQFYRRRERLAVIGFAGPQAQLLLAPCKVAAFNAEWIAPLQGGGATPVQSAVAMVEALLRQQKAVRPGLLASVWLLTDGRFDPLPARPQGADSCHIVDFEQEALALQRCARLARDWGADCVAAEFTP